MDTISFTYHMPDRVTESAFKLTTEWITNVLGSRVSFSADYRQMTVAIDYETKKEGDLVVPDISSMLTKAFDIGRVLSRYVTPPYPTAPVLNS
jgi:hypothetical protein